MQRSRRRLWERLVGVRSTWRCPACQGRARRWLSGVEAAQHEASYGPTRRPALRRTPVERGERLVLALMAVCLLLFALALWVAFTPGG